MEFSEHIKTANVEDVELTRPLHPPIKGTLCVTAHHLLFSGRDGDSPAQLLLLLRNIDAIEKSVENLVEYSGLFRRSSGPGERAAGSSGTITVKCKDLCVLQLDIPGMEECLNIARSIEVLSSLDRVTEMYPFFHRPSSLSLPGRWGLSSPEEDFSLIQPLSDRWRLSQVNRDYSVCPSYPPALVVPRGVDDQTLAKAAKFRQGGRFPVLAFYHRSNGQVIMRSSQPLTGANRKRCREDELLLQAVIDGSERGYIIDTRSAQLAHQARMTGGGFESKSHYHSWRRLHRNLERGKGLQESLMKLAEACSDQSHSMDRWLSRLENSKWLNNVNATLSAAGLVAECVEREGCSVLVHGYEGTDTTLLLTTLAQLILEPRCRSLRGFLALLEREWIQAGHPFQQRCARSGLSHARPRLEAPSFLLLLDCVWQLGRQFPLSLGFSEALLLLLARHAYASEYGSFLCDCDRQRCALGVKENTHCLFQFLCSPRERGRYSSPLYQPTELAIWPSVQPQALQLWRGLFFRWTEGAQYLDEAWEEIRNLATQGRGRGCGRSVVPMETEDSVPSSRAVDC
ncbi:myotubularin-related protein 9 isoform X1 [Conger conger]|uniref:myotubularin-related protein 9 isoform X1 n=1 Tax=Conger conger TaxID=82655 RepID=UPI002A59CAEE|nr:myotubularin-related protein 9 isoform X1 [Conger conger]